MRTYTVPTRFGGEMRVQLDEDEAKRLGAKPVSDKQAQPSNKQRKPANKG